MAAEEPTAPDQGGFARVPVGVTMDRADSLRWLRARDAGKEAAPAQVHDWTLRVLGMPAARRNGVTGLV